MDAPIDVVGSLPNASEPRHVRDGLVVAGTYRISRLLGSGGMGDVYEAEHVRLGSLLAVKLLRANGVADPRSVERFRHEARRIASVRSENIVKVFDYGELPDGTPYFVMERLFGEDLRALLAREGPLPIRRAVKLVLDACRGVAVVHDALVVHRDLKPANLFVEESGSGTETCKVLDFGVMKVFSNETTLQGALLGTLRYMAPEQLENAASAKASADVYALGSILYECLTGTPVHGGETQQETMFAILHRDPLPPSQFRDLPVALEAAVLRALSRDASQRFSDAREFSRALAPFGAVEYEPMPVESVDEDTLSDGASLPRALSPNRSRPGRRPKGLFLALGALLVGAVAGWYARGDAPPPARAEAQREIRQPAARSPAPATPPSTGRVVEASEAVPRAASVPLRGRFGTPEGVGLRDVASAAVAQAAPVRPGASQRTRPQHRPTPAAAKSAQPSASFVDRFDSHDPYE